MDSLSYTDVLLRIRQDVLGGDFSVVYSICRAVACIGAFVCILGWFNKASSQGTPIDQGAVLRTLLVLFLTCNFYSFVLGPVDGLSSLVSKSFLASVERDRVSLDERIASLLERSEKAVEEGSLAARLRSLAGGGESGEGEGGEEYLSSSILEASADREIEASGKESLWEKAKGVLGTLVARRAWGLRLSSSLLCYAISLLSRIVRYVLTILGGMYLMILSLIGPFVFALGVFPPWREGILSWVKRYIQISFWAPMCGVIDFICVRAKEVVLGIMDNPATLADGILPAYHLMLLDLVAVILLFSVPSLCTWIVQGDANGGRGGLQGIILAASRLIK